MSLVYLVVCLHHLQKVTPSVSEILQLMSPHVGFERILKEEPVVELYVKEYWLTSHVANAKSHNGIVPCKGRVVFVFCIYRSCILMDFLIFYYMEIKLWGLSLHRNLVPAIFFDSLVETLNLIFGKVVVKPDCRGGFDENRQ